MSVKLWRTNIAASQYTSVAGARSVSAEGGEVGDTGTLELAGARAGSAEGGEVGDLGGRTTRKRMKLKTQAEQTQHHTARSRTAMRCCTPNHQIANAHSTVEPKRQIANTN